jgi:hypothetical protein
VCDCGVEGTGIESRQCPIFFIIFFIFFLFFLGPDISKYFFNGIFYCKWDFLLQKEGFQHLAKSYSYNYCEYYEEIPGNNLFMIFLFKKSIFGQNTAGAKELILER